MKARLCALWIVLALLLFCGAPAEVAELAPDGLVEPESEALEESPLPQPAPDAPDDPDAILMEDESPIEPEFPVEPISPIEPEPIAELEPSSEPAAPPEAESPAAIEGAEAEAAGPAAQGAPPALMLGAPGDSLAFESGKITIGYKESVRGALNLVGSGGAEGEITYVSSKPRVVRVNAATGRLYGAKPGSATITASLENGQKARCKVVVKAAPKRFRLKPGSALLGVGESTRIGASFNSGAYSYARNLRSSDESVARIEGNRVVAVAPGSAIIRGETYNGKRARVKISVKPAPESVRFPEGADALGVGMKLKLDASVNPGAAGAIRYSIVEGEEFASLKNGALTAAAIGSATVRATAYNGVFADWTLEILAAPTSVALSESKLRMGVGERLSGALHASPNEGSAGAISFKSTKPGVVKVNPTSGRLTARKKGTAYVYAVAYNGAKSRRCKVVVGAAPGKISISMPLEKCSVGQSQTAAVKLKGGGYGHWTVSSSDPSVVEVRDNATLIARSAGEARIRATSYNSKSASVRITVVEAPSSVEPKSKSYEAIAGLSKKVKFLTPGSYTTFTYESSDPEIASVEPNGDGTVSALREGDAVITATTHNGLSAEASIHVYPAPEELVGESDEARLGVGEKLKFAFQALPEGCRAKYSYSSSDPSVAQVSKSGVITGAAAGSATITARAHNGPSARLRVKVIGSRSPRRTAAIAHRGASAYRPENTMRAFTYAVQLGAEMIETDVRRTRDGEIVLFHDASIRTEDGSYASIESLELRELRAIKDDIVTLGKLLEYAAGQGHVQLAIEFKTTGAAFEREVLNLVRSYRMVSRTCFIAFDWSCVKRIHEMEPSVRKYVLVSSASQLDAVLKYPSRYNYFDGVDAKYTALSAKLVRSLHQQEKDVIAWTVNGKSDIQRMKQLGVDAITTDYPDRV